MTLLPNANENNSTNSPHVKEITAQNFMQEVIQASLQIPVLVYFTASWCGPCKQFGPLLEKVVNDSKGKIRLARVDVDKNPQIAAQFRVQSVPMVYVFMQGQPLDAFSGALPESQLRQLVTQLLNAAPQSEEVIHSLEEAKKLMLEGKLEQALQHFAVLFEQDSNNIDALIGIISVQIALGDVEQAEALLATVPEASLNHEGVVSAKAALALLRSAPNAAEVQALQQKLAENEFDHQARCELAAALFVQGREEDAINELMRVLSKDRQWNDGAARAQLLTFFEALGHTHPLTMQGRRKLSTLLFA